MRTKFIACLLLSVVFSSCGNKKPVQTIEVTEYKVENGQ
jgi:hypothetical protein